jgi:hypothetical protein
VVGDLDGDGKTEVVVISSLDNNYFTDNGPLVVLEGASGKSLWNSREALQLGAMVSQTPILVDLDGDGSSELIFVAWNASDIKATSPIKVVAIDYKTKAIKYQYADASLKCGASGGSWNGYCMGAAADIDGDGKIEVVFGNSVLSNQLTLKKSLTLQDIGDAQPSTVTLAELDLGSPGLEIVINGSNVFNSSGVKLWSGGTACKGYSAVSDINSDGANEVICVGGGKVTAFTNSGAQIWQSAIPIKSNVATMGGPPNVGNFLGDDKFEIGLAGGHYYVVFDHTGKEVWKQETQDFSSHRTGSTIFDFNGDGKMEVIYNDEQKLRIYAGEKGTVLWETDNPSGTLWEYPLVANVDDDISSELIVSSPTRGGVRVFEDPKNLWMYSRRVWNQYSYFPELVDDLLKSTPIFGQKVRHGFRVNSQGLNPPVKNPCQK